MTPVCSWGWDHSPRGSNPCYRWWNGGQVLGRSLWQGWWQPGPLCHPVLFTTGCPVGPFPVSFDGRISSPDGASGRQGRVWEPTAPHALLHQVLLLCQEGGLKLALNGQGVGATSLGQQVLEQLRELRVSGSVQLCCIHYWGGSQRRGPADTEGPASWPHSPPLIKSVPTMSGLAHLRNQEPESADALGLTADGGHKNVKAPETLQLPLLRAWDLALLSFRGL